MTWAARARYFWLGLASASLGGSLVFLGLVLLQTLDAPSGAIAAAPGDLPPLAQPDGHLVRFSGALPPVLEGTGLLVATANSAPDLSFLPGDVPGGVPVVTRYLVPVAPLSAGVDSLSMAQLTSLLAPAGVATWESAGGIGGRPRGLALAADAAAIAAIEALGGAGSAVTVPTYDDLFALLAKPGAGYLAFVPLGELRPAGVALAIDGLDLARGTGEAAEWPFVDRISVVPHTAAGRDALPAVMARLAAPLPRVTRVVATGDILQSRCTLAQIRATGDWAAALRGPVGEYLAGADLALGSLDGSIQDINPPYLCVPGTNLSSPPEVMAALTLAGFDGMTVATNHVFDCGIEYCGSRAFLQTLDRLRAAGIQTVGGGRDLSEAMAAAVFEVNGVRFGVLGFDDVAAMDLEATASSPGTAPLDDDYGEERAAGEPAFYRPASELGVERFTSAIRLLKAQVDVVIVQVQSGTEDTHVPTARSIKALRAAADAGADLVVGNQAHWVQAAETRGPSFIAYALGNFVFDQTHTPEHTQGYLLEATFHGSRLVTIRMLPYQIEERYRPVFAAGALRLKILGDVMTASQKPPVK